MKNLNRRQFNQLLGKGIVAVPVGTLAASLPSRAIAADLVDPESVSYTHLTLPTNREVYI